MRLDDDPMVFAVLPDDQTWRLLVRGGVKFSEVFFFFSIISQLSLQKIRTAPMGGTPYRSGENPLPCAIKAAQIIKAATLA